SELPERGAGLLDLRFGDIALGWHLEPDRKPQTRRRGEAREHLGVEVHPLLWRHVPLPAHALGLWRRWGRRPDPRHHMHHGARLDALRYGTDHVGPGTLGDVPARPVDRAALGRPFDVRAGVA